MSTWLSITLAVIGGLLLFWLLTLAALALVRPRGNPLTEAIRLLPDLLRLIPCLARDQTLPRGVRVRLWLLLAYLAMPIDLVPDFIPVLGYADDAIVVAAVLRSVVRHAGAESLARHWPGTDDGLAAIRRLAGLPPTSAP
ncbi:YkvA family protein [Streptomyces acidicola]|uniref:YkvA family protein n=1 Tax=Streptomyces acidicola TaxID=2596892 RepID=UPI0037BA6AF2